MCKVHIMKITKDGNLYLTPTKDNKELEARLFPKDSNSPFLFNVPVTETQAGFFVSTFSDKVFITVQDLIKINMFNL